MLNRFGTLRSLGVIPDRNGRDLEMWRGYDDSIVDQLIEKSKQPHIVASTPKDVRERFTSRDAFGAWVTKSIGGRVLYPLIDAEDGDLAGAVWLGTKIFPYDVYAPVPTGMPADSYAIRMYEGYQGQGLAKPLSRLAIQNYDGLRRFGQHVPTLFYNGVWLETEIGNAPGMKTYLNLYDEGEGFRGVGVYEDHVAMVLDVATIEANV